MFPLPLRKDHWIPLVHAIFPTHLIANHMYRRLLDHRAWRLTNPPSITQLALTKKHRNEQSKNQVPTSIADLAHITKEVPGRMIMNWDRMEERYWAKDWSSNIWHADAGFKLKKGHKLDSYKWPAIDNKVRRQMGWVGGVEPPKDLAEARERSATIWKKMHAKQIRKAMAPLHRRKFRNPPEILKRNRPKRPQYRR